MSKRITTTIQVGPDLVGILPHTVDDNDRDAAIEELTRFERPTLGEVRAVVFGGVSRVSRVFYEPLNGDLEWSIDDTGNGKMTLYGRTYLPPHARVVEAGVVLFDRVVRFHVIGNLQTKLDIEIEIERDVDLHEPLGSPLELEELKALAENYFRRLYAIQFAVSTESDIYVFFDCDDRPKWAQIDHTQDVQPVQWIPGCERFEISGGSRHGILVDGRVHWNSGAISHVMERWLMPSSPEMARDAILSYELQR